jgi:hypothetical protein
VANDEPEGDIYPDSPFISEDSSPYYGPSFSQLYEVVYFERCILLILNLTNNYLSPVLILALTSIYFAYNCLLAFVCCTQEIKHCVNKIGVILAKDISSNRRPTVPVVRA